MRIPKTLKIAGKTYRVIYATKMLSKHNPPLAGQCVYPIGEIRLSENIGELKSSRADIEQTYLHEVWHCIWSALGDDKFCNDERRADAFSSLLHQVLTSGKGQLVKPSLKKKESK